MSKEIAGNVIMTEEWESITSPFLTLSWNATKTQIQDADLLGFFSAWIQPAFLQIGLLLIIKYV